MHDTEGLSTRFFYILSGNGGAKQWSTFGMPQGEMAEDLNPLACNINFFADLITSPVLQMVGASFELTPSTKYV